VNTDDVDRIVETAGDAARHQAAVAREVQSRPSRKETRRVVAWSSLATACVSAGVAIAISLTALHGTAADTAAQQAANAQQQAAAETAQAAYAEAQKANQQLAQQGKPQVAIVPPADSSNSTATLISAAAAQVLASLPANVGQPTAAQLGQAISNYIAVNPQGPTAAEIAAAASQYFSANAALFKGATGDGIASISYNAPNLTVTLTDGTSQTWAIQGSQGEPGPTGPTGPTGPVGPPPAGWGTTYANGDTSTCTPSPGPAPDPSSPQYTCSTPAAPPS